MIRVLFAFLVLLHTQVWAQPKFKGGQNAFAGFLKSNTIYPQYALQNCIQGTVNVSFKINSQGRVYFSSIKNGTESDLDDEALRLIRLSSGKWQVPAGFDTTMAIIAPVHFKLSDYDCETKDKELIKAAITAYQARLGLTQAILNFYKNKEKGSPTVEQETKILSLKEELGYNDKYLARRIKDGLSKLKQGDKQGACEDFIFVKHMGSNLADVYLQKYCK